MTTKKHNCPYCRKSFTQYYQLNNHVRMSAGEHGKQGEYPKDWDIRPQTDTEPREEPQEPDTPNQTNESATKPQTGKEWIKISELEDSEDTKKQLYELGFTEVRISDGELR